MELDFDTVKSYGAALLRSIERSDNSWENWPAMKDWQDRHMDTLRFKAAKKAGPKKDLDPEKEKPKDKKIEGVPEAFIRSARLCIAYQMGKCQEEDQHTFGTSNTLLTHSCAICLRLDKTVAVDHHSKNCPRKKQLFRKGGGK